MRFAGVLIALLIGTGLVVGGLLINKQRPAVETAQPGAAFVRATGKCASCHRQETSAIVHQFERSPHAAHGVTCLDCHQPVEGQQPWDHRGFVLSRHLTAKNCSHCHMTEYQQYLRSRHAAPAWAAVTGPDDFTPAQIEFAERYHPGTVRRDPNVLAAMEGPAAITKGCAACHSVGRPNPDGSIGSCTACHSRHNATVALAREPETCGQCHMGPDHSQIEIYHESKHGIIYHGQRKSFNLSADPKALTTADMPAPTCSTCHMSGLEGLNVTHDTSERLSWFLFAPISQKRPNYARNQDHMQATCLKCHARSQVEQFYEEAEAVLHDTNARVAKAGELIEQLRSEGLLTPEPFDEPIEFIYFDYWHYWGRTAKHGAFMGGADFVQWHGNYELVKTLNELEALAEELRKHAPEDAKDGQAGENPPASEQQQGADSSEGTRD